MWPFRSQPLAPLFGWPLKLEKDDLVLLRSNVAISTELAERIKREWDAAFKGVRVAVIDGTGFDVSVIRSSNERALDGVSDESEKGDTAADKNSDDGLGDQ